MHYIFMISLCLFLVSSVQAQHSCCSITNKKGNEAAAGSHAGHGIEQAQAEHHTSSHTSATAHFAGFASDADFTSGHDEPLAYTHQTTNGKEISYPTPDGQTSRAFAYMAPKASNKYLLVIHEWWGLNDHIKREAERYFKELGSVNVLALDLYDGKVAGTREEAQQYVQAVNEERVRAIIQGALNLAGKEAEIATIGWCFGGGWSLQAAIQAGNQAQACVIYYGMPEQDVQRLKQLDCEVLGIFASQDGHITPAVVEDFKMNMEKADKELEVKMYDAKHAFANPSNPAFNKSAADNAFKLSTAFLKKQLN
ncbi:dienelactone hydrolase-like enzyme [Flammeovirgaceae bacterium 311]|nr:dienelactone hydrolase-like enzyme [Flammeovirgaceae bacterium 311]